MSVVRGRGRVYRTQTRATARTISSDGTAFLHPAETTIGLLLDVSVKGLPSVPFKSTYWYEMDDAFVVSVVAHSIETDWTWTR